MVKNHKEVTEFPVEMRRYLEKEKGYHAILGPFKEIPFPSEFCVSLLNTVSKKDSLERRTILDLSFLKGSAVNELIPKDYYLDTKVNLTFPRVDNLEEIIKIKEHSKKSHIKIVTINCGSMLRILIN